MDLATVVGFVLMGGVLVWSMLAGGSLSLYYDLPSVILVFGGMIAAVFVNFPLKVVTGVGGTLKKTFIYPIPSPLEVIERMAEYSVLARREGLLALEEKVKDVKDPFLYKGIMLVVDGFAADSVREILQIDLDGMSTRHSNAKKVVEQLSAYAPAFGMIGTLVGLVAMLANLNDPSSIGSGMAVALLTTYYGAVLSNGVFIPLAGKLEMRCKEETLVRTVMIEGILALQAGDKPQVLREKLKAFLSPSVRKLVAADKSGEKDAKGG
ncbi:MAG TPA: motility protein A [Planctomycetota bacterium]|nr:motility protein A [Planctomycetota bacterium]